MVTKNHNNLYSDFMAVFWNKYINYIFTVPSVHKLYILELVRFDKGVQTKYKYGTVIVIVKFEASMTFLWLTRKCSLNNNYVS